MTLLRTLKQLVLGETWLLPLGVGLAVGACVLARSLLPLGAWEDAGGFALLACVAIVLTLSVGRSTRRRP